MNMNDFKYVESFIKTYKNPKLRNFVLNRLASTLDINIIEADQPLVRPPFFAKRFDCLGLVSEVTRTDQFVRMPRTEFDEDERKMLYELIVNDEELTLRLDLMLGVNLLEKELMARLSDLYVGMVAPLTIKNYMADDWHGVPSKISWNTIHPKYSLIKKYINYLASKGRFTVSHVSSK